MIVRSTRITKSGAYQWPWSGGGLIIVKGASGGDGGTGSDMNGAMGGKGGEATLVTVEAQCLAAGGGDGGHGGQPAGRPGAVGSPGGSGKPGKFEFYSVSLSKGTEIQVQIGEGGDGGPGGKRDDEFLKGMSGDDGEVQLLPTLS